MNTPRKVSQVTDFQLQALAKQLETWSQRLTAAANVASQQPEKSLPIYNWPSVSKGLQLLRGFIDKADEARSEAELGVLKYSPPKPNPKKVAETRENYQKQPE
jgi:hypothetical protein